MVITLVMLGWLVMMPVFILEHGWIGFLEKDLAKLLAIEKAPNK